MPLKFRAYCSIIILSDISSNERSEAVLKIGLDLGYANITISDPIAEIYREPSVALITKEPRSDMRRIIAVGNEAMSSDFAEGDAGGGVLVRPFKNGLLFDSQITKEIITHAMRAVRGADKVRCAVGIPSDFMPKQEKELFAMLSDAGVAVSFTVARPVAAIIGAGYSPSMSVISVNIGALSTEIAVMHNGEVLRKKRVAIGGENFDRAVKEYILEQGEVSISLMVARAIKERLGAVWKGKPNDSIDIEGTLSLTGNKLRVNVTTEDIVGVFEAPMAALIQAVFDVVKTIPKEAVEAIFANGIVLTGGGAELFGIEVLMSKVLGISVTKPEGAIDCVAKGLSRINAFVSSRAKVNGKNITDDVAAYYESSKKSKS